MEGRNHDTLLRVEGLSVDFHGDDEIAHAVNDVSFELRTGATLGLVGETGAGKTTIAKAILRILPEVPSRIRGGKIYFNEINLLDLPEKQMQKVRGKDIAMIFQDPMTALNPTMTIGDQVAEAILLHEKLSPAEGQKRALDMLKMVGIDGERYDDYPHQFSGGMKQRVVIAMALACKPQLLIADEPTTALDVTIQAQVLDMMIKLRNELGTSVIMITHDLGVIAETCDDVAVVYAGEIVEYGTAEDVFDRTAHPYTEGLFNSLPSKAGDERRLRPISGMMPDPAYLPPGCKFADRCPYADERCKAELPQLRKMENGHAVRCWKRGKGQ